MNTRLSTLTAMLAAIATISACQCDQVKTTKSFGEIGVVVDGQVQPDRSGTYDFGSVFTGQTNTVKIVIRNLDKGTLNLIAMEPQAGSAEVTVGDAAVANAKFEVKFAGGSLGSSEAVEIEAVFMPPESTDPVDYTATLLLRVDGAEEGKDTALITLKGKGIPGICELPKTLDFGNIAVDDFGTQGFVISNPTQLPVTATINEIYSTSGDHAAFGFSPTSARGSTPMEPESTREVSIEFRPTEQKSYLAFMKAQAAESCPEQTITLTGSGVTQVLSWAPAQLDCGYVTPGVQVTRELTFQNAGSKDVNLTQIKTLNNTEFGIVAAQGDDATKLTVPAATRSTSGTWDPGSSKLTVFCKPINLGPRQTQLTFSTGLSKQPTGSVTVKVFGGGPDIEVKPSPTLNFGKVAYFAGANPPSFQTKKLSVINMGTAPSIPDPNANLRLGNAAGDFNDPQFTITSLNADTQASEFEVTLPSTYVAATGLEAKAQKNTADLLVKVTPQSVGLKEAELTIYSNDPDEPVVKIKLTADAVVLPPCNYTVSPSALNFGLISPPNYRDLGFTITNNGTQAGDICLLSNLDMTPGSNAFFTLPLGPIESRELAPGEALEVLVRVWPQGTTPAGVTNITGSVDFFMSSPIKPQTTVTLNAQLAPSCLTIAPSELDFGTVQVGCSSSTRTFSIYNTCSSPVILNNFSMQAAAGQPAGGPNCPGTAPCPEFLMVQSPAIPTGGLSLAPGSNAVTFQTKYKPIDFGSDTGAVAISATQNGTNVTYVVALHAKGDSNGIQTDVFTQDAKPKADILLVLDNSGSMGPYQASMAANFAAFIKYAISAQVDYHIAAVVTEASTSPWSAQFGWFVSMNGEELILTPTTTNVEQKFKDKVNVGTCCGDEHEAAPALLALTPPLVNGRNAGFLRQDAALAIVALTDEPDHSPNTTSFYMNGFWNIKGFNRKTMFSFNAIAGFSPACKSQVGGGDSGELLYYVTQSNGVKEDICTPDWSKALENLGKTAFGFRTNFFLTSAPDLTKGPITVDIDGTTIPQIDSRGATVWQFDSVGNSVNFEPMYVPEPGQTLTITYYTTCYP